MREAGKTLPARAGAWPRSSSTRGRRRLDPARARRPWSCVSGNEARSALGRADRPRRRPGARASRSSHRQGRVIDLGTEFGLSVDARGGTTVRVFEGTVEAAPLVGGAASGVVTLHEDQAARIDGRTVDLPARRRRGRRRALRPPDRPAPVVTPRDRRPRSTSPRAVEGHDPRRATGPRRRPHASAPRHWLRLSPPHDPNLRLLPDRGVLELTTTRSDINTQVGMPTGEYPGVRLSDFGFTGTEDFAVSAEIPQIPGLASVGQFGLYAGARSDEVIRGGLDQPDRARPLPPIPREQRRRLRLRPLRGRLRDHRRRPQDHPPADRRRSTRWSSRT